MKEDSLESFRIANNARRLHTFLLIVYHAHSDIPDKKKSIGVQIGLLEYILGLDTRGAQAWRKMEDAALANVMINGKTLESFSDGIVDEVKKKLGIT